MAAAFGNAEQLITAAQALLSQLGILMFGSIAVSGLDMAQRSGLAGIPTGSAEEEK